MEEQTHAVSVLADAGEVSLERTHTAETIRFDEASARFLNAHRRERRTMTAADFADPSILKKTHVPNGGLA